MTRGGMRRNEEIQKAEGKLGVLIPGMGGAVSTTFLAGVEMVRQGQALPVGSLTQMGTIRLGKRFEHRIPRIRDFVPLAHLADLVFGGWDVFPDNCYGAALQAGALQREHIEGVRSFLEGLEPWPAVFNQSFVKKLVGSHVKSAGSHLEFVEAIRGDIEAFKRKHALSRCVMI